jgi:hypothetical protein
VEYVATSFSLDFIGQSQPNLRHVKQRNFAPAVRKIASDFKAMRGIEPVARHNLVGRHPRFLNTPIRISSRVKICSGWYSAGRFAGGARLGSVSSLIAD